MSEPASTSWVEELVRRALHELAVEMVPESADDWDDVVARARPERPAPRKRRPPGPRR